MGKGFVPLNCLCLVLILADFDLTGQLITEKDACYLLLRTDLKNSQGEYTWYLMRYVPDKAKVGLFTLSHLSPHQVRDKMIYASTVATLKLHLGSSLFVEDLFGTVAVRVFSSLCSSSFIQNDVNSKGYRAHLQHKDAAIPLTEEEKQKQEEVRPALQS